MAISFNQIPANVRQPLFYAEIDNSQANSFSSNLKTLLFAQTITVANEEPTFVGSESRAIELFGVGSMAHLMVKSYFNNNTQNELYVMPLADAAGATKATHVITLAGVDLLLSKTAKVIIGGMVIEVNLQKGDSKEERATKVNDAINLDSTLPFVATVAGEVVTLTARNGGLVAGQINVSVSNLESSVVATAGTGDPNIDDALMAKIGDVEFENWVSPYIEDGRIDKLTETISSRWNPEKSIFGHVWSIAGGTVTELKAIGERPNNQHLTIVGVRDTITSLASTLVAYVGQASASLSIDPARPLQTLQLNAVKNVSASSQLTFIEKKALLYAGISPLTYDSGKPDIVRAITTFRTNAFGANDVSYLDVNTLATLALIVRYLKQVITSKFARVKLVDNGTLISAGSNTVSPNVIRNEMIGAYDSLITSGVAENAPQFEANLIVERNQQDPNRLDVILPPDLVNQLRVFAVGVQFRLNFGVQ